MSLDITKATRSTCPYCGVGCGVLLTPDGQGGVDVKGDPDHPSNFGRLCSKGSALGETVGMKERLLAPLVDSQDATWDDALDLVAQRFSDTIAKHGPKSVAFYVSGQLLTEDYYIANKLIKGYMGSANIDTNSRLCMASSVAGHKRAFGTDTVPGTYEDLEKADLIVLTGSNLAWCHPVLYQRILAAREKRGTKIIVIDPRRTSSCDGAEMHLPIAPGGDVALFNRLLAAIKSRGAIDPEFMKNVDGAEAAFAAAAAEDFAPTGLSEGAVDAFIDMWLGHEKVVTIYSQGVNQSSAGADKVNAILNCHLATGRIGRAGMGPFSVTGQPNAMGGREVGGLANMLACHLDLENADHRAAVSDFWKAPANIPDAAGTKAVDLFQAVGAGKIKALWIIHTNPAVSMPDADAVRDAIEGCEFSVISDITAQNDTARLCDVVLPAAAWGEKDGMVTNSDRMMSRQRAVFSAPGEARADWKILCQVAQRMGWKDAFDFETPAEIFREFAALSEKAGEFGKDFDISDLKDLDDTGYGQFKPTRWPQNARQKGGRFFGDGQFFHAGGKAKMLPVTWRAPMSKREPRFPFVLNTGRIRDQWHTMLRSGLSPRLSSHYPEPFLEIHPQDAERIDISETDLVTVNSPHGTCILRANVTDTVVQGQVFAPMHWTAENAPTGRVDALVAPNVDPISGQPESKASVVNVQKFVANWYGFAVTSTELTPDCTYWAKAKTKAGWRIELAGCDAVNDWESQARSMFDLPENTSIEAFSDAANGRARIAFHLDGKLIAALFISNTPVAVMRDYLSGLPGESAEDVLTGRTPAGRPDPGPILCACFSVGVNTILRAIEEDGLMSVEAIGKALSAGTNCGSCKPEIANLLSNFQTKQAAE